MRKYLSIHNAIWVIPVVFVRVPLVLLYLGLDFILERFPLLERGDGIKLRMDSEKRD